MPEPSPYPLLLLLSLLSLQAATVASASEYSGRINLGAYQSKETFTDPVSGSNSNDAQEVLGSAYFDATGIGPFRNEFTLDLRDKYDSFGQVDTGAPRLVTSNEPQLRQLAVKYPYEEGNVFWALGRFPVADAAVLGNDGAELGYKVTQHVSLGLFGGLYPEQREGRTVLVTQEEHQEGLVVTYQEHGTGWDHSTYFTTAFVGRQPVTGSQDPDAPITAPPDATQPVTVAEDEPLDPYVFWYTNLVLQASAATRYTFLSHVDLQPAAHVRNIWASAYHQMNPRLSGNVSLFRIDLTEYERQRDIRDLLPASAYTAGRGEARYKLTRTVQLVGDASAGVRSADNKSHAEANGKIVATSVASGHLSLFAGGGYRKSFISHDQIARAGVSAYASRVEFDLTQQAITEQHDNDETLHPLITDASVSFFLVDAVVTSATVEYAKDERTTITSGLLTLGYRFNSRQLTPVRDRAPALERL